MYFVIAQEGGASWDRSRPMREQEKWAEHAAFVDALAEEGLVVLAGPLGDGAGSHDHVPRALLVVDADSEDTIHERLAADPWIRSGILAVTSIHRWEILLGQIARHWPALPAAEVSGSRKASLTWENACVQASIHQPSSGGLSMAKATRLIRPRTVTVTVTFKEQGEQPAYETAPILDQRHPRRLLRSPGDDRGRGVASLLGRQSGTSRCPALWPGDLRDDGGGVAGAGADGSAA